ncbi:MAG: FecR domain-containing protein [Alphaproteobacteria bacterium]|nr:FecR domain-containing protein [Alphaproteobacteria bacterium]
MAITTAALARCLIAATTFLIAQAATAASPIGQIKTAAGAVTVERAGASKSLAVGDRVYESDTIVTGNGTVGITFVDNSMMALGPQTRLALDQFAFDPTTHDGRFNASLSKGTLTVKSGQIVKQTPEAMRIKTPAALLGVRGTEFAVRADDAPIAQAP